MNSGSRFQSQHCKHPEGTDSRVDMLLLMLLVLLLFFPEREMLAARKKKKSTAYSGVLLEKRNRSLRINEVDG